MPANPRRKPKADAVKIIAEQIVKFANPGTPMTKIRESSFFADDWDAATGEGRRIAVALRRAKLLKET